VFHMFAALAEFERELMRERTLAGIAAARARGRKGGRRHVLDSKQRDAVLSLLKSRDLSVADIARQFGISRSTIYNIINHGRCRNAASPVA